MDKLSEEEQQKVREQKVTTDIAFILKIAHCLDTASKRGAWNASEATYLGSIYDTLVGAVNEAVKEVSNTEKKEETEKPAEDGKVINASM